LQIDYRTDSEKVLKSHILIANAPFRIEIPEVKKKKEAT